MSYSKFWIVFKDYFAFILAFAGIIIALGLIIFYLH